MFLMPVLQNYRKDGAQALGVSGINFENDFKRQNHNGTIRALYHTFYEGDINLSRDYNHGNFTNDAWGGCHSFCVSFWAYYISGDIALDLQVVEYEESGSQRSFIRLGNGSVSITGLRHEDGFYPYEYPQEETWTVSQNANSWHHYTFFARGYSDGSQDITLYYDGSSRGTITQSGNSRVLLPTWVGKLVGSNQWHLGQGLLLGVRNEQHTNYPYINDTGLYTSNTSSSYSATNNIQYSLPGKLPARLKQIHNAQGDEDEGVYAGMYQLCMWWKHGYDNNWLPMETATYRAKLYNGGARDLGNDGTATGLPQPQIYLRGDDGSDLTARGSLAGTSIRGRNKGSGTTFALSTSDTSDYWRWHEYAEISNWNSQVHLPPGYWFKTTPQSGDTFS